MSALTAPTAPDVLAGVHTHVPLRDTVAQTLTMAWRATKKMQRNPE
jgi:ABC-2 type transport system permease protein